MNEILFKIILGLPAILLALTIHEYFHGWIAWQFGDPTAKYEGRLSLNPISHLDPVGASVLAVTFIAFGMPFGWAKPVPVVADRLANPRLDMVFVAFGGPASNLVTAFLAGLPVKFGLLHSIPLLELFVTYFVMVNIGLALFNLIPVPPLDGWKILTGLLPWNISRKLDRAVTSNPAVSMALFIVAVMCAGGVIRYPYMLLSQIFLH